MPAEKDLPRLTSQSLKVLKLFIEAPTTKQSGVGIMKATGLSSGTLYPILFRFEHHGLLESAWESGAAQDLGRPRRRLYTITRRGTAIAHAELSKVAVAAGLLQPTLGRS